MSRVPGTSSPVEFGSISKHSGGSQSPFLDNNDFNVSLSVSHNLFKPLIHV